MAPETKRCNKCREVKPHAEFWRHNGQSDGRHPSCKVCGRARRRVAALSPEQVANRRERQREWRENNPDAVKRHSRKTYDTHHESRLARAAAYRESHREQIREYFRELNITRPDRIPKERWCEYSKAYAARHPDRVRVHTQRRRARLAAAETSLTRREWDDRVHEFNGHCAYCLEPMGGVTLDHFRPLARDGGHVLENVVPACGSCNSSKKDRLVFDWLARGLGQCRP